MTTVTTSIPEPVLAALDRLNGHARAFGCGRKAIYEYKTLAALHMAYAGSLTARPVSVEAKCIACGGSGLWADWVDHKGAYVAKHTPCRKCSRSGKVTLRFVETRFGDRCWHHPAVGNGWEILRAAWRIHKVHYPKEGPDILVLEDGSEITRPEEELITDWQPNRPSEKIEGEAAAELLNAVEDWVLALEPIGPIIDRVHASLGSVWPKERAIVAMRHYSLDIGRTVDACCCCGVAIDDTYDLGRDRRHNFGFYRYGLHWAERCCETCRERKHPEKAPPAALVGPSIASWLERRGIDLTQPWKPAPATDWSEEDWR